LPGKALIEISGISLIRRLIRRLKGRFAGKNIVLCTTNNLEDDIFIKIAEAESVECFRGENSDVMKRFIDAAAYFGAETIARVTGDNPLTDPYLLEKLFSAHCDSNSEYTYNDQYPIGTRSEIISVKALQRIYPELTNPSDSEYMTFMLMRPDKLRVLSYKMPESRALKPTLCLTVDTQDDLDRIVKIYTHFDSDSMATDEIVDFVDVRHDKQTYYLSKTVASPNLKIDCSYINDSNKR